MSRGRTEGIPVLAKWKHVSDHPLHRRVAIHQELVDHLERVTILSVPLFPSIPDRPSHLELPRPQEREVEIANV